ncbi:MAG: hypothetical protein JW936_09265 [Sedimentisphaerales bacterium]|nr:hypothetical protein [Sedimentisphaerales bacterium]
MSVLVGIDEAGYGPILGPLVMSAAVWELPDDLLKQPLWDVLRASTAKVASGSAGRIIINDSKKLKQSGGGYGRLQRGVLAALAAVEGAGLPGTLGGLLKTLGCDEREQLAEYPWYGLVYHDYGLDYDVDDVTTAGKALAGDAGKHGMKLRGLWARPLWAGHFNRLVEAMENKATVSFYLASQLIDRAYREFGDRKLQIMIDKQGGRSHYRAQLQRLFPQCSMKILKETDTTSSYELTEPGRAMKIHFLAKGETRQMPIALASMISKYVREVFMELLNKFFLERCPEIKPTAGYYTDGQRFLADLAKHDLPTGVGVKELLVRQR